MAAKRKRSVKVVPIINPNPMSLILKRSLRIPVIKLPKKAPKL